jgi:hypothetical protein
VYCAESKDGLSTGPSAWDADLRTAAGRFISARAKIATDDDDYDDDDDEDRASPYRGTTQMMTIMMIGLPPIEAQPS